MRGFGANQAAFAIENLLDRLAEKVGHRRATTWRDRNILERGEAFATGPDSRQSRFGLRKTLESVKEVYKSAKYRRASPAELRNVGIGNGMPDIGKAAITVVSPDEVHIRTGFTEMGQGAFHALYSVSRSRQSACRPRCSAARPIPLATFGLRADDREPWHGARRQLDRRCW